MSDSWDQVQIAMAEDSVRMYAKFMESSKWDRFGDALCWVYLIVAVAEIVLGTLDIVYGKPLFDVLLSYSVAVGQLVLYRLNRRTRETRLNSQAVWKSRHEEALEKLEALDPQNVLIPHIIDEVP